MKTYLVPILPHPPVKNAESCLISSPLLLFPETCCIFQAKITGADYFVLAFAGVVLLKPTGKSAQNLLLQQRMYM